jgi:leucyl/phenylalanyl-tRNA--protein transferase
MQIPWLETDTPLPPPESAQKKGSELDGLVAAGGGLSTQRLKEAYRQGIFPWYSEGQPILWWSPDPRMVLKTADFKLHRSLKKTLQRFIHDPTCEVRIDSAFAEVINLCAHSSRKGQPGTWIVNEMMAAYQTLHEAGFAHSVETWVEGRLVGGLYCVAIGHAVFGESMFTQQSDASKIALAALVAFAREHGIHWIDCQQNTRHLNSLGGREMPRSEFLAKLRITNKEARFSWRFDPAFWAALELSNPQA